MSITVYGIKNCDSVKKARKALEAAGTAYSFHDFRSDGLSAAQVAEFISHIDNSKLLNKRSTTWKQLSDDEQAQAESDLAGLLLANPTLIKRPVISAKGQWLLAPKADELASL